MKPFYGKFRPASRILFTAEHASIRIPHQYKNLGLSRNELANSKDWYDPGSLMLAKLLSTKLNASLLYANFSRLVIDANRRLDAKTNRADTFHASALKTELLIEDERGERLISIPGNQAKNISNEEKNRWQKFVLPYQQNGIKLVKKIKSIHGRAIIIQVHSFYPKYNRDIRTIDIDVISDRSNPLATKIIKRLKNISNFNVGHNKPWGMKSIDGGIFGRLQKSREVDLIAIDINNKHLKSHLKIKKISALLIAALSRLT